MQAEAYKTFTPERKPRPRGRAKAQAIPLNRANMTSVHLAGFSAEVATLMCWDRLWTLVENKLTATCSDEQFAPVLWVATPIDGPKGLEAPK